MNPSITHPADTTPADPDLQEQARPGFGVPSQDPRPAAQEPMGTEEAGREARSVLVGGGVAAGAAAGATLGVVAAGPVGVVVGAALGAVAGAVSGAAAGAAMKPDVNPEANPVPKQIPE
jgi:ABC-type dipeptide/oligopeptide/nickel transport system permease subunit